MDRKNHDKGDYKPRTVFSRYKPRDIVYPGAVARHFDITVKEVYTLCKNRVGKDLRMLYMIKCPVCNQTLPGRYYSIPSIDTEYEYGCTSCNTEFFVDYEKNIMVYFEKM